MPSDEAHHEYGPSIGMNGIEWYPCAVGEAEVFSSAKAL